MGVFDFLKITVFEKKKPAAPARRKVTSGSFIEVDSKSFPLAALTTKGFVATKFDDSLIKGQTARITVRVDDDCGKFTFPATIGVNEIKDGKLVGEWNMLAPEIEATIRKYAQNRKQKTGR
ncbi:hypothetical protein [Azospirillum soli]|uniref:hypothetical protein n=1 Tax=Azospirillum soli TaxID=1304799 RepID=UPI001AE28E49|nr:hypothetical protein [Azospirillum soli]MBP2311194.1 hypothetical protein [Azospirillum soli]